MKFKVFGTDIKITFYFFAFLTLLVLTDKSGFFIPMMVAVLFHEAAHLITMRLVGCAPKEIVLIPASIRIVRGIAVKNTHEIAISLSGPLANIMFFCIFYVCYLLFSYNALLNFAIINLM